MVNKIIDTIQTNNIDSDCYQVLIIGGKQREFNRRNSVLIPFNQQIKKYPWVTKKKNIITECAKYDNIVYSHDYYGYPSNWYSNIVQFSSKNDWDIYMNRLLFRDRKTRSVDWACTRNYIDYQTCMKLFQGKKVYSLAKKVLKMQYLNYGGYIDNRTFFLPYERSYSKFQIICGTWWVAKKSTMLKFPLDQQLTWHMMQDNKFTIDALHLGNSKLLMDVNNYAYMLKEKKQWELSVRSGGTPYWPKEWD